MQHCSLLSKTPTGVVAAPVQQVHGHVGGDRDTIGQSYSSDTDGSKVRCKMKMAPMAIPKFSGKTVDYPEWKKLFKDCIEAQYEESAAVMTMKTQALPEELKHYVPSSSDLKQVWEKLDKKFLDPTVNFVTGGLFQGENRIRR